MAEVVLSHVYKIFDKNVVAVDDVNFEVKNKEFVVLVGPSGCGKSTTLRMIAGLEEVSEGGIHIDGKVVNDVPPKDRDIAMVFQNYALYPHMTVYDNMAFGLKLRKYPKKEIKQRVFEAAELLGIKEYLDRKPKALSGGQRQRVAVGRAIVRKPKVFLFDEPLSNLDAKLRVQMRTEIIRLHDRLKATMIYVTHDQIEAMTMGDRIVVLRDGKVQQIDTPLHLYNHPRNKFVAGFIGSPAMNFMEVTVHKNKKLTIDEGRLKIELPDKFKTSLEPYVGKKVTFGIRPEDIFDRGTAYNVKHKALIKSKVDVVEPMGNELYLYLTTGLNNFIARVETDIIPPSGIEMELVFNMDKVHFFDNETEEIIE